MGVYLGNQEIANNFKLPNQAGNAGKALVTDGTNVSWGDASSVYRYSPSGTFSQENLVVVDSLSTPIPSTSQYSDAVWMYTTPVYPYVPMTNQVSGYSYTFTHGGMVICNSPNSVTIASGELASFTFSNFVGILPVSVGTTVTTSSLAYFSGY